MNRLIATNPDVLRRTVRVDRLDYPNYPISCHSSDYHHLNHSCPELRRRQYHRNYRQSSYSSAAAMTKEMSRGEIRLVGIAPIQGVRGTMLRFNALLKGAAGLLAAVALAIPAVICAQDPAAAPVYPAAQPMALPVNPM